MTDDATNETAISYVSCMEEQIQFFLDGSLKLYDLVNDLEYLSNKIKSENKVLNYFQPFIIGLDCIQAERESSDYFVAQEIPFICYNIKELLHTIFTYKKEFFASIKQNATAPIEDFVIQENLQPLLLADSVKKKNLKTLIKLSNSIKIYLSAECSLNDLVFACQEVVQKLEILPLNDFCERLSKIITIVNETKNKPQYTTAQMGILCKSIIEITKIINFYKENYLTDIYSSERYQRALKRWPEHGSLIQNKTPNDSMQQRNNNSILLIKNYLTNYGTHSFDLTELIYDINDCILNIAVINVDNLVEQILILEIINESKQQENMYTEQEIALIGRACNEIHILLNSYR